MVRDGAVGFGARLRELREQAGLTQDQLAERAEMHRQGIAKLELGEREPAWSTVIALAEALGVSTEEFRKPAMSQAVRRAGRPSKSKKDPAPAWKKK